MKRRQFLQGGLVAAAEALGGPLKAFALTTGKHGPPPQRKLDAHIHLFNPLRPGGILWPQKSDSVLYQPALPARYRRVSSGHSVVGAIAIEASPLGRDNDWLLNTVQADPIMVGAVGNLVPGSPEFSSELARLRANPLFLGIRYGNLWKHDLAEDVKKPGFLDSLKQLAQAGLVFESANPDPRLIGALVVVAEAVQGLRIIIDHLPHATIPVDKTELALYQRHLGALASRPQVFVKLSEIPVLPAGAAPAGKIITDPAFYQPRLDAIWNQFGEDRLLFGSDWPNSDTTASYGQTLAIVAAYLRQKSDAAQRKYYFENSRTAYRWKPRTPAQN